MYKDKILGIIGGHGYNTAIELQYIINKKINEKFNTRNYIKTFIINDATINNDDETILNLYENTEVNYDIEKSIFSIYNDLIKLGCTIITIPCNTYSNLLSKNKFITKNNVKIINIVDSTKAWISYNLPTIKNIGLIATQQTIKSGLYHNNLKNYNIITFDDLKLDINSIILCVQYGLYRKSPSKSELSQLKMQSGDFIKIMNKIILKFLNNRINHLILGCTELPVFVNYNITKLAKINYIDTLSILAETIINV